MKRNYEKQINELKRLCESDNKNSSQLLNNSKIDKPSSQILGVSPNPFSDQTVISFNLDDADKDARIDVFDEVGRLIKEFELVNIKGNGQVELSSDNLQSGIYFCSLIINGEKIQTTKIVISKH